MVCLLQEAVEAAKLCVGELDKHPNACSHALIEQLTSASASAREFYGAASSTIRCCDGVLAALEHINKGPATTTCCCMLLLSHWCWAAARPVGMQSEVQSHGYRVHSLLQRVNQLQQWVDSWHRRPAAPAVQLLPTMPEFQEPEPSCTEIAFGNRCVRQFAAQWHQFCWLQGRVGARCGRNPEGAGNCRTGALRTGEGSTLAQSAGS